MKKHIFLKFLFFYVIFFFQITNSAAENKIVVKVNEKIISSYEIKNKINTELVLRNLTLNQNNINRMKGLAVSELINLRVKESEIKKYNIEYADTDISKQLISLSSNNIENLKKKFLNNNLSFDIFIKEQKIHASWQKLIYSLYNDKVKLNENEIEKEIENFKKNISKNKEFDLSEIEIFFNNENEKEKKIKNAKEYIQENGFENSISILSESDSAKNNGRLGLINEKALSKDIFEKLKNLNEGEVSEPIVQLDKIIFLKINKIKISENKKINNEKLKKDIINKKRNDLFNLYSKSHLSKIKNNSFIEFK